MMQINNPLTASDVLHAFHRGEINLFLGAAFATVGLVTIGFSIIRRKLDVLLFCFALFAILYGARLWMQSELMALMVPPSDFFDRLVMSINFVVPIPAFIFFQASGFLRRAGKNIAYVFCLMEVSLLAATILGAPLYWLNKINSIVVIAGVVPLIVQSFREPEPTKDFRTIRAGLLIFIAFILLTNV